MNSQVIEGSVVKVGNTFVLDANSFGGSLQGYITAPYAGLVKLFGEPNSSGDDYKVSTEWTFRCVERGFGVSLYDYKETNRYDSDYPSVEDFRAQPNYEWHIGANSKHEADLFVRWLLTLPQGQLTSDERKFLPNLS